MLSGEEEGAGMEKGEDKDFLWETKTCAILEEESVRGLV